MSDRSAIPLYLFAKVPHPGLVMTRLAARLGTHGSAALAARLLTATLKTVCNGWPGRVVLCVWPDPADECLTPLIEGQPITLESQQGEDLGSRMMHALERGISESGVAAVVGYDLPELNDEILCDAHAMLAGGRNVIGPAADGGFYLVGLQKADYGLFDGVDWGSENVLNQLLENTSEHEISFSRLKILRDIDTWDDLLWLVGKDPGYDDLMVDRQAL